MALVRNRHLNRMASESAQAWHDTELDLDFVWNGSLTVNVFDHGDNIDVFTWSEVPTTQQVVGRIRRYVNDQFADYEGRPHRSGDFFGHSRTRRHTHLLTGRCH